jgi:hypothetical protein
MLIPLGFWAASGAGNPGAYELIATGFGSGSASFVNFASIPQTYKHLEIRMTMRNTGSSPTQSGTFIQFNGDGASNYATHLLSGNGSSVSSSAQTSSVFIGGVGLDTPTNGDTTNAFGAAVISILDYTSTSKYKTVRKIAGVTVSSWSQIHLQSGLWQSTSAITSLMISTNQPYPTAARFSLYGVKG